AHQARDRTTSHSNAFPIQLEPHLPRSVDTEVLLPHPLDRLAKLGIAFDPRGIAPRILLSRLGLVVDRRSDRQLRADRLDSVRLPLLVDELVRHFGRRSSSAWAKYACALHRISFARRSSKFSRPGCFSRSRASLFTRPRLPAPRPGRRTHL